MNTALKSVSLSKPNSNRIPETASNSYQVVCERCHKIIYFSGQKDPETFTVLCDTCTLDNL